ncbi:unnamed protein product [Zymoseptoria tritici ST99CH_3D7]|uniref:histidine kinase n=1 Tax=Zymoseptoria tritici (strain ST99CH_3D7) TaxID=1276538 RepID=A0A1X7RUR2_ZYMT9|nr:unnamed protein product [Zymoseptoria tritici ST99CH_3D7]
MVPLREVYEKLEELDPLWLEETLRQRWRQLASQNENLVPVEAPLKNGAPLRQISMGPHDITRQESAVDILSDHLKRFRSYDWASTDLGPMSAWSYELRRMINLCMADPRPVALWWGPNRTLLHNDAYRGVLQERYPRALGKPVAEVWHDVPSFPANFDVIDATGKPAFGEDTLFFVTQDNGRILEAWISWAIMPLPGETGNVGYYNSCSVNTRQIIYERRMSTLLTLERYTSSVSTVKGFWAKILKGLDSNHADIPFATLYTLDIGDEWQSRQSDRSTQERRSSSSSDASSNFSLSGPSSQWVLQGVLESASEPEPPELPESMSDETSEETFGISLKVTVKTGQPKILRVADGTFPRSLQARAVSRAYGDLCQEAVLIPITRGRRHACLFIGLNPRCLYDADHERFISMLKRQLASSLSGVVMAEEETRQAKVSADLAARERMQLTERLNFSEQDAKEKEMRFRSMADQAPVGMFEFGPNGEWEYANDSWYALTQHPRDDFTPKSWTSSIHPDDRAEFDSHWSRLLAGETIQFETRLAKPFISDEYIGGERLQGEAWASSYAYAEKNADGSVRNILGCVVDISQYKFMQGFQERRTAEALELKRQQEAFMDTTSHEARNPLSAMSLCVESIISTLQPMLKSPGEQIRASRETIKSTLESAEMIMECVQHQKFIMDDVLTLSKIGSGLLVVSPIEIQPLDELKRGLRLFEGELRQADIPLQLVVDPSYKDLNIDYLLLDPTRLLQILINLITNAIKFTKDEAIRRITVTISASRQRPESNDGFSFMPNAEDSNARLEVEEDSAIYLQITVEDTGRGIERHELDHLFQRFQQASPKTHVKYGGSGLGLFICRELAKMQGGQIGVSTAFGRGSKFAFYLKAKRCGAPVGDDKRMEQQRSVPTRTKPIASNSDSETRRRVVLLVEDNLVNQKVMAKQLRSAGHDVTVANHGQEALDHIRTTHFCVPNGGVELDVVLMDIEMPIMGGLECTSRIREMEMKGEIQGRVSLIAVTANARAEQQKQAMDVGFDAVITKPFKMEALRVEMDSVCGGQGG